MSDLDGYAVVAAAGSVDTLTHPVLAEHLGRAIEATRLAVIVDMSGVHFCDSSGLNAFARADMRAGSRGISLIAAGLQDRVHRVFTTTGIVHGVYLMSDVHSAVRWLETGTNGPALYLT
ncbi:anti-sigma factor antagonist [Actinomadura sp. KC216]|uniref:STAS domain-containing protein n=1 Tax=Actinomadura sp. KC216 TaxID=2530370 RepID=UPI0010464BB5|nr:STAS domain-containing protein [Actinomadura sp. KC216]TDB91083.1 anti-sigma factor antagonist [Actinomadura sp. KC216]